MNHEILIAVKQLMKINLVIGNALHAYQAVTLALIQLPVLYVLLTTTYKTVTQNAKLLAYQDTIKMKPHLSHVKPV